MGALLREVEDDIDDVGNAAFDSLLGLLIGTCTTSTPRRSSSSEDGLFPRNADGTGVEYEGGGSAVVSETEDDNRREEDDLG